MKFVIIIYTIARGIIIVMIKIKTHLISTNSNLHKLPGLSNVLQTLRLRWRAGGSLSSWESPSRTVQGGHAVQLHGEDLQQVEEEGPPRIASPRKQETYCSLKKGRKKSETFSEFSYTKYHIEVNYILK